jgi:hypothetical protein
MAYQRTITVKKLIKLLKLCPEDYVVTVLEPIQNSKTLSYKNMKLHEVSIEKEKSQIVLWP